MTKQSTEDLIAENRKWFRLHQSNNYQEEAARRMALILDALEAAEQDRNQLAAVVEQVRAKAEEWQSLTGEGPRTVTRNLDGGIIEGILATAPADALREVKAEAIREYVTAARENPHTYYWPPSGVLDDAEQWADEIEKGTF